MVFNVMVNKLDDHLKNHSFIYDDEAGVSGEGIQRLQFSYNKNPHHREPNR